MRAGSGGALWGIGKNSAIDLGFVEDTPHNHDERAVWRLFQAGKANTPGQSLWYLRLALDRLITDQVQRHIDPGYDDAWRRMDRLAREQEQGFWWAPGETAPTRGPEFISEGLE